MKQLNEIRELAGLKPLKERYETSADWDADWDKLQKNINDALAIMNAPNWQKHIEDTETNFSVDANDASNELHTALETAKDALDNLMRVMMDAA